MFAMAIWTSNDYRKANTLGCSSISSFSSSSCWTVFVIVIGILQKTYNRYITPDSQQHVPLMSVCSSELYFELYHRTFTH